MNSILSVTKIHLRSKLSWFYLPFSILIFSFLVNFFIKKLIDDTEPVFMTGGLASIYIYLMVIGMFTIRDTFSFSISFSISRKDYFLGTLLNVVFVSGLSALLLNLANILEELTHQWGGGFYFFNLPYLHDGPLWQQWLIAFSLFLHIFYTGFLGASIYRGLGKLGIMLLLFITLIVPSIFSVFAGVYGWWETIFAWFIQYSAFQIALGLMPLTLIYLIFSYLLLRRSTI